MNDDRVERLELKLAFLEQANQELSDALYRQQQDMDALRQQVRELLGRIDAMREEEPTRYTPEQEKPPHY